MKKIVAIASLVLVTACAPQILTSSWKSEEYIGYKPKNILIVGVTQNTTGRMLYEQKLKQELNKRGINASQSALIFEDTFKNAKQTEEQIENKVNELVAKGYETILISAVRGIDERVSYDEPLPRIYYGIGRFGRRYYMYQDIYFMPGYYSKYKIYHLETSLYNIKSNNEKSLVWVGSYDLVNPGDLETSVNRYVRALVRSLENDGIISSNY